MPSIIGLNDDVKVLIIFCQSQIKSFNYLFGKSLEEQLFTHTRNLSATLQKKDLLAITGKTLC